MKSLLLLLAMTTTTVASDYSSYSRYRGGGNAQTPGNSTHSKDRQGMNQGRSTTLGNRGFYNRQPATTPGKPNDSNQKDVTDGKATKKGSGTSSFDRQSMWEGRVNTTAPGTQSYFNQQGVYQGRSVQRGSSVLYYDRQGKYEGRAATNSQGQATFYDRQGKVAGRSSTTKP